MFPYFEKLEEELNKDSLEAKIILGDHVHWGYWNNYSNFLINSNNFNQAAKNLLERIIEKANIKNGQRILDVGCGYGGTIRILNEKFSDCELIGINIDEKQIKRARDLTKEKNNNKISFVKADAINLPFEHNSIDNILAVESIFHFESRDKFLKECSRVLKEYGKIVLSDFVPIKYFSKIFSWMENKFNLAGKAYGNLNININRSKYTQIARNNDFEIKFEDVTKNTLPTYKILKNYFKTFEKDSKKFISATTWIEIPSKLRLLKYLLISLEKNEK